MKELRLYYKYLLFVAIFFFSINLILAQENLQWTEISLLDASPGYRSSNNNPDYPTSNLFDDNFRTCWVANSENDKNPVLYLKLPELDNWVLNIFSGYGKSQDLFDKNAKPRRIRLSVFEAINPSGGYVTEIATLYKALEFPQKIDFELKDTIGVQSVSLSFKKDELNKFIKKADQLFTTDFKMGIENKCLILKVEILDSWKGTKYDDICISEIFFNNKLLTSPPVKPVQITDVYINDDENTLLIDDDQTKGIVVYHDKESILQLMEVSKNKKWAILISMPAEIEGRTETFYLLVDLVNRKVVNDQLEKCTGNYISGSEIFFDENEESTNMMYNSSNGEMLTIELK